MSLTATRRAVLIGTASTATIPGAALGVIPSWMQLKIEVHKEAAAALVRATQALDSADQRLDATGEAAGMLAGGEAPAWYLEAEQVYDLAVGREFEAAKGLIAERPRSLQDVQERCRYLIFAPDFADRDGFTEREGFLAMLLASMTGEEG